MTPDQVTLVQFSFKSVAPIAAKAADLFYDRLFEIAPEVRQLFPADLSGQKVKLIGMLAAVVNNLHQLDVILPTVRDLGTRHRGYGVTPDHYERRSFPTLGPRARFGSSLYARRQGCLDRRVLHPCRWDAATVRVHAAERQSLLPGNRKFLGRFPLSAANGPLQPRRSADRMSTLEELAHSRGRKGMKSGMASSSVF